MTIAGKAQAKIRVQIMDDNNDPVGFPVTLRGRERWAMERLIWAGSTGVTTANRKHLFRIGLDDAAVEAQLQSFHDAVQSEIIRQQYVGSNNPKGAA